MGMYSLFNGQMDYIFFFYGLAFLILAGVCFSMRRDGKQPLPWIWLGLFGVIHGINEFLDLTANSFGDSTEFFVIRICFMAGSFIFLIEFGRAGMITLRGTGLGRWIFLPLLFIATLGGLTGWAGLNATSRYALGLVGGIWSARVLYLASQGNSMTSSRSLFAGSIGIGLYGIATGIIVPEAPFFPASLINHDSFFQTLGFPIQLARGIFAIWTAVSVGIWSSMTSNGKENDFDFREVRSSYTVRTALTLLLVLLLGWIITEAAGRYGEGEARRHLLLRVKTIEVGIPREHLQNISGILSDIGKSNNEDIKQHLLAIHKANSDCQYVYLIGLRDDKVSIFADSEPVGSKVFSTPGDQYAHPSPEIIEALKREEPYVVGPYDGSQRSWVSAIAPVKLEGQEEIVAYIGMDFDANKYWIQEIAINRLIIIGTVFVVSLLIILLFIALQRNKESAIRISELRLEAVRLANEKKIRDITSTLGEGVFVLDQHGYLTFMNPEAERLLGWCEEELLGRHIHDIIHYHGPDGTPVPSEQCILIKTIQNAVTQRSDDTFFLRKDGTMFPVSFVSSPFFKNAEVAGSVTAFQDIAERKQAEDALKESEERYRTLFEKTANPILVIEGQGYYIDCNEAALQFMECTREELLQKNVLDTTPPYQEFSLETYPSLWDTGGVAEIEYYVNGKIKILELTITPVIRQGKKVVIGLGKDITERRQAEAKIRFIAYHDALTGLPNRILFEDHLRAAIINSYINKNSVAVILLDLDRFKTINDTLGHGAGDQLLKGVAGRLKRCISGGDTIARLGGDEFTILLSSISCSEEAAEIARKILEKMNRPLEIAGREFHVTPSIGITFYPDDGRDAETLLRNADIAMYRAKEQGRNNYQFYTPAMNAKALERMEMENSLRRGLERDEFIIYYQPQIDVLTGKIVGMEALLRWQHPSLGLVPPMKFIPLAEETGLIVPLGEWVLRSACTQTKNWQESGYKDIKVAVNLSARQFLQRNLREMVVEVLKETALEPQFLELEITETIAMQDLDYTNSVVGELKNMGVHISIDDFGTGYSSLSYLKRFPPIDTLKIDRSFVSDVTGKAEDAASALVATMIVLARNLKMRVVAEGVETEDQLAFLVDQKCDELQGFLFSKPIPALDFESLLARQPFLR